MREYRKRELSFLDRVFKEKEVFYNWVGFQGPLKKSITEESFRELLDKSLRSNQLLSSLDEDPQVDLVKIKEKSFSTVDYQKYSCNQKKIVVMCCYSSSGYSLLLRIHREICERPVAYRVLDTLVSWIEGHSTYASISGKPNYGSTDEIESLWLKYLKNRPMHTDFPNKNDTKDEDRLFLMNTSRLNLTDLHKKSIDDYCKKHNLSREAFYLSALQVFLHSYTRSNALTLGFYSCDELENRLPICSEIEELSFPEWCKNTAATMLEVRKAAALPFGEIVDLIGCDKSLNSHPIFQVFFQTTTGIETLDIKGLMTCAPYHSHFDMVIETFENGNNSELLLHTSNFIFPNWVHEEIGQYLTNLILNIISSDSKKSVTSLTLLDESSITQLVQKSSASKQELQFETFSSLFEETVRQSNNKTALTFQEREFTYSQLNSLVNQVGRVILSQHNPEESKVGLCCECPLSTVVLILAALKSGKTYVPIDPEHPKKRIDHIASHVDCLITDQALDNVIVSKVFQAKRIFQLASLQSSQNFDLPRGAKDRPPYIIFTSGSTGEPKGVIARHSSIINLVSAIKPRFSIDESSNVLGLASFAFDASVHDWACALGNGASLHLIKRKGKNIVDEIKSCVTKRLITHAFFPPSLLSFFEPSDLKPMRVLMIGAEPCTDQIIDKWSKDFRVVNGYGPTEATVFTTTFLCDPSFPANTIGFPLENVDTFILDPHGNMLPDSVPGELHIGGQGLASGYLADQHLTEEKFRYFSIPKLGKKLLYSTGDLVKRLPSGQIEYLGRLDSVVKIRGYRVSLDEISRAVEKIECVKKAVCVHDKKNDLGLVAYVVPDSSFSPSSKNVDNWQDVFDKSLAYRNDKDATFNIAGWNSSYTGRPLSDGEMREWLQNTTGKILSLKPERLLEIGCGSGLILFKIAPYLKEYRGIDISKEALLSIQRAMPQQGLKDVSIGIYKGFANNLNRFGDQSMDTIVCNSVLQYFPNVGYLYEVLDECFRVLKPNGKIFFGDIRNFDLAKHFHGLVQYFKKDQKKKPLFDAMVLDAVHRDPELMISPLLFHSLKERYPNIIDVRCEIKPGDNTNELTQFRYDVSIITGKKDLSDPQKEVKTTHWSQISSLDKVKETLLSGLDIPLRIEKIPNKRLDQACQIMKENHYAFDRDLKSPNDFYSLAKEAHVDISVTFNENPLFFDVVFSEEGLPTVDSRQIKKGSNRQLHNLPFSVEREALYSRKIRDSLSDELPQYMVPDKIVYIDQVPLNSSGKLDRKKLPVLDKYLGLRTSRVLPKTNIEKTIAEIWAGYLHLDVVGRNDSFMDLGGNSFLHIKFLSDLEKLMGVRLSIVEILRSPLSEVASMVESKKQSTAMVGAKR